MTPDVNFFDTEYTKNEVSNTYKMNTESLTIEGLCCDREAVKQAVYKLIMTEKNTFVIYDKNYGIMLNDLYGRSTGYVSAIIRLRLEECFKNDSRIKNIENLIINKNKSKLLLQFTVNTIYGTIDIEQEF